jgi:DNA-binding LacI/PurR family transcriptional regulator
MGTRKAITLREVAENARVSTATVRRVLLNQGYVAAETRRVVEQVLEATGYHPNLLAQSLRRQRTAVIGHILKSISPNLFYAQVALGAEVEALAHGYTMLAYNMQRDPQRERIGVEALLRRQVDAIIFTTPVAQENVQLALDFGVPVVQVERPTKLQTNLVLVDNYTGAAQATEHLIRLGHQQIAFLGTDEVGNGAGPNAQVDIERMAGYLDTMRNYGLSVPQEWLALGRYYWVEGGGLPGDGYRLMQRILDQSPLPTAIFAGCDIMAAGALQAIYARGLRVPDDISLIGFDDTLAPYLSPPLTTVAQPMEAIGRVAVQLALAEIANAEEDYEPQTRRLAMRWVERASTAPPRSSETV